MLFYRRAAAAAYVEAVDAIEEDMVTRYGALPPQAHNLLDRCRVKAIAAQLGAKSVVVTGGKLVIEPVKLTARQRSDFARMRGVYIKDKGKMRLPVRSEDHTTQVALQLLTTLLPEQPQER